MILTLKYRVRDKRVRNRLRAHAWSVNQAWNYCVAFQRDIQARYVAGAPKRKWPSHFDLNRLTAGTSEELALRSESISETCRIFAQSRDKTKRAPAFRSSTGSRRSLGWIPFKSTTWRQDGDGIIYSGHKYYLFGTKRRPLPANAKGGCFVEDGCGRWWFCVCVEVDELPLGSAVVGIDLGLKTLATMSDGQTVPALQHFRQWEGRLAVAQRAGNRRRVSAIHSKIANARRDQLHKATTKIARENSFIAIGNVSAPKLAKTRMAKSVLDASWGMFRSQLEYKASRHRAVFLVVDEAWTSRTCSACGTIPTSSPKGMGGLGIRSWVCSECDTLHDRDVNAAKNILRIGQSTLARADESRGLGDPASREGRILSVEAGRKIA